MQGDPAVLRGDRAVSGPHRLSGGKQLIEHLGRVIADPARQNQWLPCRCGYRYPGQLVDDGGDSVDAAQAGIEVLPIGQKPCECRCADGLDLRAQRSQGPSAQNPEDLGIAPLLRICCFGSEFATYQLAAGGQRRQGVGGNTNTDTKAFGGLPGGEGAVCPGISAQQLPERIGRRVGEGRGHTRRYRHPERVTQPCRILDGRPPGTLPVVRLDHPARGDELTQPVGPRGGAAGADLFGGDGAQEPEQIGEALGVAGLAFLGEVLQLLLGRLDDRRVEQLAQFYPSHEFGEQTGVQ